MSTENIIELSGIDIVGPLSYEPLILVSLSGYQSNPGYEDIRMECYPWKNINTDRISISGYDDLTVSFFISVSPCPFRLKQIGIYTNDFYPGYLSDENNEKYIFSSDIVNDSVTLEYTYHSPTKRGVTFIQPFNREDVCCIPSRNKPNGFFTSVISISGENLYDCTTSVYNTEAKIHVFERWPEARFYMKGIDDPEYRKNLFFDNEHIQ